MSFDIITFPYNIAMLLLKVFQHYTQN